MEKTWRWNYRKSNQNEVLLIHYFKNESISSINETIFICDNAKYYLSKDVKKFLKDEKLKFLFNVPYRSNFNCIELSFNLIKNKLYKERYKNKKLLEDRLCFLLDSNEIT